jgi:hypothetical protein
MAYELSSGICQQCMFGYMMITGTCYKLPNNCLSVNTKSECLSCANGYLLQNNMCVFNIDNC